MNVKRILVPIDYSEGSEAAVRYAASLATEYDAELHVVHVYEPPAPYVNAGFAAASLPETEEMNEAQERAQLDKVQPPTSVAVYRELLVGTPIDELVEYVEQNGVDLVVMGTHGRTGLERLLMGSVAEGLVRRAPCAVLTIKDPSHTLQSTE